MLITKEATAERLGLTIEDVQIPVSLMPSVVEALKLVELEARPGEIIRAELSRNIEALSKAVLRIAAMVPEDSWLLEELDPVIVPCRKMNYDPSACLDGPDEDEDEGENEDEYLFWVMSLNYPEEGEANSVTVALSVVNTDVGMKEDLADIPGCLLVRYERALKRSLKDVADRIVELLHAYQTCTDKAGSECPKGI